MTFTLQGIITFAIILISAAGLMFFTRRFKAKPEITLREIKAYASLNQLVAKTLAAGKKLHVSAGRGSLAQQTNPTSLAALTILERLSKDAVDGSEFPLATSGDGTLFVASQDIVRHAAGDTSGSEQLPEGRVLFVSPESSPMAYGSGLSHVINSSEFGANVIVGHVESELALIVETVERKGVDQLIGTQDLTAISVALSATDDVLIGEELFAAAAYLGKEAEQIASLQLQDVLRIAAAVGILAAAIISLFAS